MTIAAGFRFKGGIFVCADSQFSTPSVKLYGSKLSETQLQNWNGSSEVRIVFAMSGTDGYMQMAVEACEQAIVKLFYNDGVPRTEDVRNALADSLVKLYQQHLYPHPRYGYTDGPQVSLIVGVWLPRDGCELFWTSETTVNMIGDCQFIGSGGEIGAYSILQVINKNWMALYRPLPLKDTVLLATHALNVAKESDPYCGGESEFAALYEDGAVGPVTKFDIESIEAYSSTFQSILRNLFFAAADFDLDDEKIKRGLVFSNGELARIREEQRESARKRQALIEALSVKQDPIY
jgi:20S proteasome alpha/beta subunit